MHAAGTIRVWGSPEMGGTMHRWQSGFIEYHPDVLFDVHLHGTASSIAGIYTGVADLALLGREIWPIERAAFESVFSYQPTEIQVATGSYDIPKATYALVIYVNRANPVSQLTLEQLAGIFGTPLTPDGKPIRAWGDLGLSGEWSQEPIHTYNFDYENDKAVFFRRRVLGARYRWSDASRQFSNREDSGGATVDSGKLILDALANDPLGIAVSNPHYASTQVKALALAEIQGKYVLPSKDAVQKRTYPLTRAVYIYVNRVPTKAFDPSIIELLRYILSEEGQQDVLAEGTYLPLTKQVLGIELKKLH